MRRGTQLVVVFRASAVHREACTATARSAHHLPIQSILDELEVLSTARAIRAAPVNDRQPSSHRECVRRSAQAVILANIFQPIVPANVLGIVSVTPGVWLVATAHSLAAVIDFACSLNRERFGIRARKLAIVDLQRTAVASRREITECAKPAVTDSTVRFAVALHTTRTGVCPGTRALRTRTIDRYRNGWVHIATRALLLGNFLAEILLNKAFKLLRTIPQSIRRVEHGGTRSIRQSIHRRRKRRSERTARRSNRSTRDRRLCCGERHGDVTGDDGGFEVFAG